MVSSIVEHWRKLTGAVHPDDAIALRSSLHSFNLDFPPPAYIGDIDRAPVVLLEANGGYDPGRTPREFRDPSFVTTYLDLLHNPRSVDPASIAPYYGQRNYSRLIAAGQLVLVNAVAYRSKGISTEPANKGLAEKLVSTRIHRNWLRKELLPAALRGERLVIAHRNGLWKLKSSEGPMHGVIFTTNAISPDMSLEVLKLINTFLSKVAATRQI